MRGRVHAALSSWPIFSNHPADQNAVIQNFKIYGRRVQSTRPFDYLTSERRLSGVVGSAAQLVWKRPVKRRGGRYLLRRPDPWKENQ